MACLAKARSEGTHSFTLITTHNPPAMRDCIVPALVKAGLRRTPANQMPLNTSAFLNTQAGLACPTWIAWFGSPLPQVGTPMAQKVL